MTFAAGEAWTTEGLVVAVAGGLIVGVGIDEVGRAVGGGAVAAGGAIVEVGAAVGGIGTIAAGLVVSTSTTSVILADADGVPVGIGTVAIGIAVDVGA